MEKSLMDLLRESTMRLGTFCKAVKDTQSLSQYETNLLVNFIETQEDLAKKIGEIKSNLG